jgi:glycosyltransferase involved in cell wall biosynthesis
MEPCESPPAISVIMPVYNGAATLDRAIRSVRAQLFPDWEVVAVDDGSTDGSLEILNRWAAEDHRIRFIRLEENSGVSAARNAAIGIARGDWIAYLDQDDEYYRDYLAQVGQLGQQADVLMFCYDFCYEDGPPRGRPTVWEPQRIRRHLFSISISCPLGVAHRRQLWEKVGGFNELWCIEDWDFWKRMARTGATFAFLSQKSGLYHVRPQSASRVPHITRKQQETFLANWQAGKPPYGDRPLGPTPREVRKIAFASPHCLVDPVTGAAVATYLGLRCLQTLGFECRGFCSSRQDAMEELPVTLARHRIPFETQEANIDGYQAKTLLVSQGDVPVNVFQTASFGVQWASPEELIAFCKMFERFLDARRPDALLTYGGDPAAQTMIRLAKDRDIPVVFWLHNFGYVTQQDFELVDYVIVPSEFSRQYCWDHLGLACQMMPLMIDWPKVKVDDWRPRYLTLVNPQRIKGLYVFARIAEVLAHRRPDIPVLVMAGRSQPGWERETGIELDRLPNVKIKASVPDRREFYAETKLLVMPSLWNEAFGLVAAESMINGIPVLASNRGALPETIGEAGFLFDIPAHYTPESNTLPTAEEVQPWVETIIRLWDDAAFYQQASRAVQKHAERWRPEHIAPVYREFFANIFHQPGPPVVGWERR